MEYELYHHGIKGMKWGIRRTPAQLGHYFKKRKIAKKRKAALEKARQTKAANAKAAARRKELIEKGRLSPKKMTNEELKARMERLRIEKEYNDLVANTKKANFSRGHRFVDKFLDSSIDKIAEGAAADIVAQSVKVLLADGTNKMFDRKTADGNALEVVFTNNKKK